VLDIPCDEYRDHIDRRLPGDVVDQRLVGKPIDELQVVNERNDLARDHGQRGSDKHRPNLETVPHEEQRTGDQNHVEREEEEDRWRDGMPQFTFDGGKEVWHGGGALSLG